VSSKEIKSLQSKVALKNFRKPKTAEKIRSFLGLVNLHIKSGNSE